MHIFKETTDGDNPGLNETANVSPLNDIRGQSRDLEDTVHHDVEERPQERASQLDANASNISEKATTIYTISYLIFFSFLGTLARLGLQSITFYPGSPVVFSELWANLGGCIIMGFLAEDRKIFRDEWGNASYDKALRRARQSQDGKVDDAELAAAKKAHGATKKTIPLFIGLSTGFCGCFTSFSSFIRDAYLALANNLASPDSTEVLHRQAGYSVMAVLAVIITTIAVCMSGLIFGAHLATVTEKFMFSISFPICRKYIDPGFVILAYGCWLAAIFLTIFPPKNPWRGQVLYALIFSPIGCLTRFYMSKMLNAKIKSFPSGTFAANVLGTAILGMAWDLQHVPLGGIVSCQVLQGIQDGLCGCLTTVSTWVLELSTLQHVHAYKYGTLSVASGISLLVVVMGSMQWTVGFEPQLCIK